MKGEKIKLLIDYMLGKQHMLNAGTDHKVLEAKEELNQLITENQELREEVSSLENETLHDLEHDAQHWHDMYHELKQQLEEQKELVEIGMMWEWYYTECNSFYAITGGRLSKKRKYELLKERVIKDFREQKGE